MSNKQENTGAPTAKSQNKQFLHCKTQTMPSPCSYDTIHFFTQCLEFNTRMCLPG